MGCVWFTGGEGGDVESGGVGREGSGGAGGEERGEGQETSGETGAEEWLTIAVAGTRKRVCGSREGVSDRLLLVLTVAEPEQESVRVAQPAAGVGAEPD